MLVVYFLYALGLLLDDLFLLIYPFSVPSLIQKKRFLLFVGLLQLLALKRLVSAGCE